MKLTQPLRPAHVPCASCPYRRDVPSGIWHSSEYRKLPEYDGETWEQSPLPFYCHQRDGNLCAGWVGCHGPRELLALRIVARVLDPSTWTYISPVPLFGSGREAMQHGMAEIKSPGAKARRLLVKLARKVMR
jgi:hypothetical protein